MSSKKEIEAALSSKGIKFKSSARKKDLEIILEAADYSSSVLSREELEKLRVPVLEKLLEMKGVPSKGLKTKEDFVSSVISLNPALAMEEEEKKEEMAAKFNSIPPDAMRLVMKRLQLPEQIKASIAFSDKETISELKKERLDLPNVMTIYDEEGRVIKTKNLSKYDHEKIKDKIADELYDNLTWKLENKYLSVERVIVNKYRREMCYIIKPKNSSLEVNIRHFLHYSKKLLEYYIDTLRYYIYFNNTYISIDQLISYMNYIRIGIRWIEAYGGYKVIPSYIELYLRDIPTSVIGDRKLLGDYMKVFKRELKRIKY